jgi:tRNA A-37 threonylcarbamoyl transferase component Bud32
MKVCDDYRVIELKAKAKRSGKSGYSKLNKKDLCRMMDIEINRILAGGSRRVNRGGKKCRKNQVRNPITNRCIRKGGNVYTSLISKGILYRDEVSIGIHKHGIEIDFKKKSKDLDRDLTDIIQQELDCGHIKLYQNEKLLGKSWAKVYVYCSVRVEGKKYCDLAIKIEKCDTDDSATFIDLSKAVLLQNKVADIGLAPRVYAIKKCKKNICMTVMDKIKGKDFFNLVKNGRATDKDIKGAIETIHKMHSHGSRHGDINLKNLMKVDDKIIIFDFNYTSRRPNRTPADDWAIIIFYAYYHDFHNSKKYKPLYKEAMANICKSKQKKYKQLCKEYKDLGAEPTAKVMKTLYKRHQDDTLRECFGMDV